MIHDQIVCMFFSGHTHMRTRQMQKQNAGNWVQRCLLIDGRLMRSSEDGTMMSGWQRSRQEVE